jgi:hypothetical protein
MRVGSTVVVNPGSVGNPRDGDPRAAYAIIHNNKIELKRTAYPIEETIAGMNALPIPDKAKAMFRDCYRNGRLSRPAHALALDPGDAPEPPPEPAP